MNRTFHFVNSQHTGRPPTHYTREQVESRGGVGDDYERVTLAQARAWSRLDWTAANDWFRRAAKAVLEYAG